MGTAMTAAQDRETPYAPSALTARTAVQERSPPYHPLHLLCNKYHTDISALGGHDGYGPPGELS